VSANPQTEAGTRPALAILVLNYGTAELVEDCLGTLAHAVDGARRCVLVIDNASPDDSAARIADAIGRHGWGGWARLILAGRNDGFSAGNNLGINAVEADAYLLLNSDTLVRAGAIDRLEDAVRAHRGLAAARLEWPDGSAQPNLRRWATPLGELARAARTAPLSRALGRTSSSVAHLPTLPRDSWASGACLAIHRDVIERIGLLDEGFFLYFEDMDYCRRALEAGLPLVWVEDARVVHLKGGTSSVAALTRARARRPDFYYAARARYFAKHHGRVGLLLANLAFQLGQLVAWGRETFGGKQPHLCEREAADSWRHLRYPLAPWRPGTNGPR